MRNHMDRMSFIKFLHEFKMCCNNNELLKGAAMFSLSFFMKETATAAPTACLSLISIMSHGIVKEGLLTCYVQDVSQLLKIHAKEHIVTKANIEKVCFTQLINMCDYYIRRCPMHEEIGLPTGRRRVRAKENVRERLTILYVAQEKLVFEQWQAYCTKKLAYEATSLIMLQEAAGGMNTSNNN